MGTITAALVATYARRMSVLPGVSSPLGCWLLLALLAPHAPSELRAELETILGTSAADARARAVRLLVEKHPAVGLAAGIFWDGPMPGARAVARALPASVATGPVPDEATLDAWTQAHSLGMVERFPIKDPEAAELLLASVLATDISWTAPLERTEDLGGEFGSIVSGCLGLGEYAGQLGLVDTPSAGVVAVAAPESSSDLQVLSVIAAPEVPAADVLAGAHEAALLLAGHESGAQLVDASELDDGHAWTVTTSLEQRVVDEPSAGSLVEWEARLPAWELESEHDLGRAPGVEIAFEVMGQISGQSGSENCEAKQAAVAAYTATGFKVAAASALGVFPSAGPAEQLVEVRHFLLRFNRPYAVVASCGDSVSEWAGVPVFSAWVDQPREA